MPAAISALPSLRQLRYLVVLSEKLNFRQAADALFVTQSTLSAGIKELEAILDVQLVERDTRAVRLTALGEQVTARARELLAGAQDLMELARKSSRPLVGSMTLGVIPTVAPFLLPRLVPALRRSYPEVRLYLREDLTERLLDRLRAGQIDAAIVALPWDTAEFTVVDLFRDPFWFVARGDAAESQAAEIDLRGLDLGRLVLLEEGHCLRGHAIAACGRRAAGLTPAIEATTLHTLVQMVDGGLGVTLLPELTLKSGLLAGTGLVARPFTTQVPSRTIALVRRPTSARAEDFEHLARFVTEFVLEADRAAAIEQHRSPKRAAAR
ncbi:MAG: LysR substrate-binding domain-containing protein [Burkholderiales bacterium]